MYLQLEDAELSDGEDTIDVTAVASNYGTAIIGTFSLDSLTDEGKGWYNDLFKAGDDDGDEFRYEDLKANYGINESKKTDKKWMQKAFSKKPGKLHAVALGLKPEATITVAQMRKAKADPKTAKMAQAAINANPEKYKALKESVVREEVSNELLSEYSNAIKELLSVKSGVPASDIKGPIKSGGGSFHIRR